MAVTIEKKFWNSSEWKDISKIVFTSPNFPSPATAGTRSHIQPGGKYIGTWYEAVDFLYRQQPNQDYVDYSTTMESIFGQFTVSGIFDMATDTTSRFWHMYGEDYDVVGDTDNPNYLYYDKDNYAKISTCASGTTTISGIGEVYIADITFSEVVGDAVLSGVDFVYHQYSNSVIDSNSSVPRSRRHVGSNSVVFEVSFGEAYNCRLTAWDDDTHTTTTNKILSEGHYRVDAVACRVNGSSGVDTMTLNTNRCLVHPPGHDIVLKGNEKYYGDFDLIYVIEADEYGEYLIFLPRLVNMDDSFVAGSYDFVTTLHYEYT